MKKKEAIKIFQRDAAYILDGIFKMVKDSQKHEHGGWEEVDDETADSMLSLGEDDAAEVLRDALVTVLQTPRGLELVKEFQSPHYAWAKDNYVSEGNFEEE